jgi:hypothetical protein
MLCALPFTYCFAFNARETAGQLEEIKAEKKQGARPQD